MDIKYSKTAKEFLAGAGDALASDEARYGLIFGLTKNLILEPRRYGRFDPWFCSIHNKGVICAAAIRTPPYKVLLAHFSGTPAVVAAGLVEAIAVKEKALPGLTGDRELAEKFMELWCLKKGVAINKEVTVNQRIYKLVKVNEVPMSPGRFRQAMEADTTLVKKWTHAFHEATSGPRRNSPETDVMPQLRDGHVFLWEDGVPVSMAMKNRPTDNGMGVSYVYSPPELRGKGYATSCVAELCRNILQSGYKFCTLYTNLANPVSNAIYMKIGFKPVADSVDYTFTIS